MRGRSRGISKLLGLWFAGSFFFLLVPVVVTQPSGRADPAPHPAAAPGLTGTVLRGFRSPGGKPEGLAWDGVFLWCNDFDSGRLYKLDPGNGHIVAQYSGPGLPANPEGLAWDGEHLWTCDWHSGFIVKAREGAGRMEVLGTYPKPAGSGSNVGLEWDGTWLWLTCWPDVSKGLEFGQLYRLDPVSVQVQERFVLPVKFVEDLAWDGRYLWSADWLSGIGFAIDPATGDTLRTYATPGPNPVGMAWDGANLWITDTARDSIWVLDVTGPTAVRSTSWGAMKGRFRGR